MRVPRPIALMLTGLDDVAAWQLCLMVDSISGSS